MCAILNISVMQPQNIDDVPIWFVIRRSALVIPHETVNIHVDGVLNVQKFPA